MSQYETVGDGWGTEGEGEYYTAGPGDYATGAALQLRPLPRPGARPPTQQLRPAPRPAPQPQRPYAPPGPVGPSPDQVRQLVRTEVDAALRTRVPYGDIPARPNPDEAMFPMGLGTGTITSVVQQITLSAAPQRAFRGERLVLSLQRSTGAVGVLVQLTDFRVGDYKQLVGGGSLPADVFASDAFGVRLMLDGSTPGVLYALDFTAIVPPGEFIVVSGAVIGRAGEAAQR